MHHLGFTRSASHRDHLLQTPDTFVRAAFPGLRDAVAIVHAAPAMGAAFTEYTIEFGAGGSVEFDADPHFVYVLDGEVTAADTRLAGGEFVYFPPDGHGRVVADAPARTVVISKRHDALPNRAPHLFTGNERTVASTPLGDESLQVRALVPADDCFDFAVNTMTFQPGATLPMVEIHVMEHGLLMLEGEGIYRLGECWYPARAGDFIWMAPYCPQWFGALGKTPTKYLIYKDWNRRPPSGK